MSLNGLDSAVVQEAHQSAITEAGGWFLLKYVSRDAVELHGRGKGGVHEARLSIARYEEPSPLYGLLIYRRRKVLIKYIPVGTSRVLQARTAVHFQDVTERYSPYETLLEITTADGLNDTSLAASFPLHTASLSLSSNRLHEISEDAEDSGSAPRRPAVSNQDSGAIFGTRQYKMEKRVDQIMRPTERATPSIQVSADGAKTSISSQILVRDESGKRSITSLGKPLPEAVTNHSNISVETTSPKESEGRSSFASDAKSLPRTSASIQRPGTQGSNNTATGVEPLLEESSLVPSPPVSRGSDISYTERMNKVLEEPFDFSYLEPKQKIKLGPRPVANKRATTTGVSALPAHYRPQQQKKQDISSPATTTFPTPPPPIPMTVEYNPRPISRGSVKSLPSHKSSTMTPDKIRLMKAVELRKRQLRKSNPQLPSTIPGITDAPDVPKVPEQIPEVPRLEELREEATAKKADSGIEMGYQREDTKIESKDDAKSESKPKEEADESMITNNETVRESNTVNQSVPAPQLNNNQESALTLDKSAESTDHDPPEHPVVAETAESSLIRPEPLQKNDTNLEGLGSSEVLENDISRSAAQKSEVVNPESLKSEEPVTAASKSEEVDTAASKSEMTNMASLENEEINTASSKSDTVDTASSKHEIVEPEDPIIAEALKNDELKAEAEGYGAVPAEVEEDTQPRLQVYASPTKQHFTSSAHPGNADLPEAVVDPKTSSTLNTTTSDVPTIVMSPTTPMETSFPAAKNQDENNDDNLEAPHSPRRQNSDLAKRRRGIVEPLQLEPQAELLSDDDFMDELQDATVHEAKPMAVARSPVNAYFPRRPSNQSLVSITSKRSDHSSSLRNIAANREKAAEELEKDEGLVEPAQNNRRSISPMNSIDGPSGLRKNVSSGIKNRFQALTEGHREGTGSPNTTPAPSQDDSPTERKIRSPPRSRTASFKGRWGIGERQSSTSTIASTNENAPTWSVSQDSNGNRDSIHVRARIVRPPSALDTHAEKPDTEDTATLQHSKLEINHSVAPKPQPTIDTNPTPMSPASRRQRNLSNTPLTAQPEDFPLPPSSRSAQDETNTTATSSSGSLTSRFFKRMSNLGSSNKRRSIAAQSIISVQSPVQVDSAASVRSTRASTVLDKDRSDMPPAAILGDINVQFPDTLFWKRRWLTLDDTGNLLLEHKTTPLRKHHLSEFKLPYTPDLDRQEMPHSVCLEFSEGGTLQLACEDAMSQRRVLSMLRSYWKSWTG